MGKFRWLDGMSVGVTEFDDDHRRCIAILDDIGSALKEGRLDEGKELCLTLISLIESHCNREEAFLRRLGFANTDIVIDAQKDSLKRVKDISDLISSSADQAAKIILEMQSAVADYLLRADINFKSFVQAAGASDVGRF